MEEKTSKPLASLCSHIKDLPAPIYFSGIRRGKGNLGSSKPHNRIQTWDARSPAMAGGLLLTVLIAHCYSEWQQDNFF